MIIDELKKNLDYYEKLSKEISCNIKKYPAGLLKVDVKHRSEGVSFVYHVRGKGEKTGVYLKKRQGKLVKALAQKEYLDKVLRVLEHEIRAIKRFLSVYDPDALKKVYGEMKEGKKELVVPYQYPDKEYAELWQAKEYETKGFGEDDPEIYTKRGERVRSKSEQLIADRLLDAGIPFRYEFPFVYEGNKVIHTDFTVLNIRTRSVYRWEHFGRMDDQKYRKTFFWKQSLYAQYGYIPGINMIYTFEDKENPLDTRYVDRLIKKFFL
ncbi:MAG: hypothetical protein ILP16_07670 [Spirochaetales bacterium]|nr:hypothetical protein [Spirochaetales bacterium]